MKVVYLYHDPVTKVPFYAGKGGLTRWSDHLTKTQCHNKVLRGKILKLRELGLTPIISVWNVQDDEFACLMEQELILKHGRKDLGTGSLFNHTAGGEGVPNLSAEARLKMSIARKNRVITPETCARISAANKGRKTGPKSEEHRAKLSVANIGHIPTAETRAKLSVAGKGRKFTEEHKAKLSAAVKATKLKNRLAKLETCETS